MKPTHDHSFTTSRLLESDPGAYLDKLLQQLNEFGWQIDDRADEADASRAQHGRGAGHPERGTLQSPAPPEPLGS